jgi:uncharacterized protein YigE (DUF2233 family)
MRTAIAAALLCFSVVSIACSARTSGVVCKPVERSGLSWTVCDHGAIWIVETTRPISLFWTLSNVPTLRRRAANSPNYSLFVNGGYHDGDYANPKAEGLMIIDGQQIGQFRANDRQLTHVISLNAAGSITAISAAVPELEGKLNPNSSHLQTGPIIIQDGEIKNDFIVNSLNGNDAYKRTAIGRTANGETVIVIAKTPYTLTNLALAILRTNNYRERRLTLVNLDGGPSTAIHSANFPQLSYGADKLTPTGFAVRR